MTLSAKTVGCKSSLDKIGDDMPERDSDILDLHVLFRIWLRWGWIALIFAAVGAYVGLQDARRLVPIFEASTIVMPESGGVGISDALSQITSVFGGGGSGNLGGKSRTFDRFKVMAGSIELAERLQEKHGLLQEIFASQWNEQTEAWIVPPQDVWEDRFWFRKTFDLRIPVWIPPNTQQLADYLDGKLEFETEDGTDFIKVSVKDRDPAFALRLLTIVYDETDNILRDSDLEESRKRRQYVEEQLGEARLVDSRQALISILTNEERRAMLLESDLPYAARILEPPFVSSEPEPPNYRNEIGIPAVLFGLAALMLVTLVGLYRRQSKQTAPEA